MTEPIIICIINGSVTLLAVAFARWLSHREHKETTSDVKQIKAAMNGYIKEDADGE